MEVGIEAVEVVMLFKATSYKPSLLFLCPDKITLLLLMTSKFDFVNIAMQSASHSWPIERSEELFIPGYTRADVADEGKCAMGRLQEWEGCKLLELGRATVGPLDIGMRFGKLCCNRSVSCKDKKCFDAPLSAFNRNDVELIVFGATESRLYEFVLTRLK